MCVCVCVCVWAHNAGCSSPSELSCHMADGNMYKIHRPIRCKNREKYMPKKKKITHKTVFTWFSKLPMSTELQGFYYSQEKILSAALQFFSLKNDIKTLISKTTLFYILRTGFTMGYGLSLLAQASSPWTKSQKISH